MNLIIEEWWKGADGTWERKARAVYPQGENGWRDMRHFRMNRVRHKFIGCWGEWDLFWSSTASFVLQLVTVAP